MTQVRISPESVRTPGDLWEDVGRLLVIRQDRLGDVLLTLPALEALRRAYPRARLGLMVRPEIAPLLEWVEGLDDAVAAAPHAGESTRRVTEYAPDLAVCISRGAASAWAVRRAGVPHRVGSGRRYYSPLFERRVVESRRAAERHEVEYALSFAHRAGAPAGPARFPLNVPDCASRKVDAWLAGRALDRRFVVLHPGSGDSCPRWPAAHYFRLAELMQDDGTPVVFSVGPADRDVDAALDAHPGAAARMARFLGSLPQLAALLARSSLLVSNSTGPIHLATALGRGALALHAPWPSCGVERWGPYGASGWGLVADCPEAVDWSRRERCRRGAALMGEISPATVLECVQRISRGQAFGWDGPSS